MTGLLGGGHAIVLDAASGRAANLDCFVAVPGLGAEPPDSGCSSSRSRSATEMVHYAVGPASCARARAARRAGRALAGARAAAVAPARRAGAAARARGRRVPAGACGVPGDARSRDDDGRRRPDLRAGRPAARGGRHAAAARPRGRARGGRGRGRRVVLLRDARGGAARAPATSAAALVTARRPRGVPSGVARPVESPYTGGSC